jgi:hypothetical protein
MKFDDDDWDCESSHEFDALMFENFKELQFDSDCDESESEN